MIALQALSAQIAATPERFVTPEIAYAQTQPIVVEAAKRISLTETEISEIVSRMAIKYGVKSRSMLATIKCEAPRSPDGGYDPLGQSQHIHKDGTREQSYGLVQINLPSHPEVTLEQAQDPEFAIAFMAQHFSDGDAPIWTCYRTLKAQGKI